MYTYNLSNSNVIALSRSLQEAINSLIHKMANIILQFFFFSMRCLIDYLFPWLIFVHTRSIFHFICRFQILVSFIFFHFFHLYLTFFRIIKKKRTGILEYAIHEYLSTFSFHRPSIHRSELPISLDIEFFMVLITFKLIHLKGFFS